MASARASLKSFMATARKALAAPPSQRQTPLNFVIGNESADLDSLCSAVLLAYFRTHTPPHTLHIPLSNLPRADLALRPELNAVLSPAGLQPDDLLTLTDLPQDNLRPDQTRWFLVDHNSPTGLVARQFNPVSNNLILGCIDHHDDEGAVPESASGPRVIEKTGSCSTLVASYFRPAWDDDKTLQPDPSVDASLARLALGPILIDTTNLTDKGKTTPLDIETVEYLESTKLMAPFISVSSTEEESNYYSRDSFFRDISRLKEDISSLSLRDILRKDYKRWDDGGLALGTSSIVRDMSYVVTEHAGGGKDAFLDAAKSWAHEQGLDIMSVMTASSTPDGRFSRELLIWAFGTRAVDVVRQFAQRNGEKLGLERWGDGALDLDGREGEWRACWTQKKLEHSRKQIAPMLREAMRDSSKL
ncbi:exopolyphosphatase [Echria macrotheca]|uniref:Exopolyphosphatase n=1 Tax=Echria macrotheca TaxID=438768 RepID=A0AAJ0B5V8_9PEZI|nr:exopolyphosphatase [Echria macrotheca]